MQTASATAPITAAAVAANPAQFSGSTQTISGYFVGNESGGTFGTEGSRPRCPCASQMTDEMAVSGPVKGAEALNTGFGPGTDPDKHFGLVTLTGTVDVSSGATILRDVSLVKA